MDTERLLDLAKARDPDAFDRAINVRVAPGEPRVIRTIRGALPVLAGRFRGVIRIVDDEVRTVQGLDRNAHSSYMHPRLASIEHQGEIRVHHGTRGQPETPEEWAATHVTVH